MSKLRYEQNTWAVVSTRMVIVEGGIRKVAFLISFMTNVL